MPLRLPSFFSKSGPDVNASDPLVNQEKEGGEKRRKKKKQRKKEKRRKERQTKEAVLHRKAKGFQLRSIKIS